MKPLHAAYGLWTAAAAALTLGARDLRAPRHDTARAAPMAVPGVRLNRPSSDSLLDATGVARELDLFRPDRAAVDSAAAASSPMMGAPPPMMVRPPLILRGLVGGVPPEAIVEGIPGVEGAAVLRVGETIAGITLRTVRRDTAVLVAKDTTWKLTVRRF